MLVVVDRLLKMKRLILGIKKKFANHGVETWLFDLWSFFVYIRKKKKKKKKKEKKKVKPRTIQGPLVQKIQTSAVLCNGATAYA